MDSFLSNVTSKTDHGDDKNKTTQQHPKPSSSELFSSAKIVADAAKAKLANQEFDQAKAAGAAADILNAASQYGKLEDDKGLGKYVDKAEDYLHSYSQKTTTTTATTTNTTTAAAHPGGAEHGQSGGGYGDYVKMAEGFLNKQSGDHSTASHGGSTTGEQHSSAQSDGGHGDSGSGLMKMAGDFLNKH